MEHLQTFSSYKAVTSGKTTTNLGTEQSIDVEAIKGEYGYLKNVSNSIFVNTYHQAYFHNGNALYRDSTDGEFSNASIDGYLDLYGVDPFGYAIEGYEIGEGCINDVTRLESASDYVYKIAFDVEKATSNVRIQMKRFGGLKDYPSFSKIEITLTVKEDLTPVKLHVDAAYQAVKNVIFDITTDCVQDYDVTFSNFDEEIPIEGIDSVKDRI